MQQIDFCCIFISMNLPAVKPLTVFAVSTLLFCASCSNMLLKMYGIKEAEPMSVQEVITLAKEYSLPVGDVYMLDSNYKSFIYGESSSNSVVTSGADICIMDDLKFSLNQPAQYMLFDSSKKLISHTVNCNAGGFPNLKWNRGGNFDVFPPRSLKKVDSSFSLSQIEQYFIPVQHSTDAKNYKYYCVVYWNEFMGRQSDHLLELAKRSDKENVKMMYVNVDDYFSDKL